jgi:hypothetical protein
MPQVYIWNSQSCTNPPLLLLLCTCTLLSCISGALCYPWSCPPVKISPVSPLRTLMVQACLQLDQSLSHSSHASPASLISRWCMWFLPWVTLWLTQDQGPHPIFHTSHQTVHPSQCSWPPSHVHPTVLLFIPYVSSGRHALCNAVQVYLAADSLKEVDELGLTTPDITFDYGVKHTWPGHPACSLTIKWMLCFTSFTMFLSIMDQWKMFKLSSLMQELAT